MIKRNLRIGTKFISDLIRSFYSSFYSANGAGFIVTISIAVCLFFASSSGNPTIVRAFNLVILPWQIAFLIYVLGAVKSFVVARWADAKRSIHE